MKLQPPYLMDQFSTTTDEFYHIYKDFMHKFKVFNNPPFYIRFADFQ